MIRDVYSKVARIPIESKCFQGIDSFLSHGRFNTPAEQLHLPTLTLDPDCQGLVVFVVGGNVGVLVLHVKFLERRQSLVPRSSVRVPNEAHFIQFLFTLIRQRRMTTQILELVLIAL
jgi:hypothetical protein